MNVNGVVAFALVCALACASAAADDVNARVVQYERAPFALPADWKRVERAMPHEKAVAYVALKQSNLDALQKAFWSVSDPKHAHYQSFWSSASIRELVRAQPEHSAVVEQWLRSTSEHVVVDDLGDAMRLTTTVRAVEELFDTEMHHFIHKSGVRATKQLGTFSVPRVVADAIDFVSGLSDFPHIRKHQRSRPARGAEGAQVAQGDGYVVPATIRRLYNIPEGTTISNAKTSQTAVAFLQQAGFSTDDLAQWYKLNGAGTPPNVNIIGTNDNPPDGESTLDMQYIVPLGEGAQQNYWHVIGWMYEFGLELNSASSPPLVVSMSYGWMENEQCGTILPLKTPCSTTGIDNAQYIARVNTEFMKAGLRGISVIACSQDEGAPSTENNYCSLDSSDQAVFPVFPAGSPVVTTVGGTYVTSKNDGRPTQPQKEPPICAQYGCVNGTYEVPSMNDNSGWTTGGGFSNYSVAASYQKAAVEAWVASDAIRPPAGMFNTSMRGYPDVAATSSEILIYQGGSVQITGGTSAGTPIFAAVMSLVNDHLLNAGKKPLGFLNPLLYQMAAEKPATFHDVVEGDNRGTEGFDCKYGYGAVKGWDPVTGLGSPDYGAIIEYLDNMLAEREAKFGQQE